MEYSSLPDSLATHEHGLRRRIILVLLTVTCVFCLLSSSSLHGDPSVVKSTIRNRLAFWHKDLASSGEPEWINVMLEPGMFIRGPRSPQSGQSFYNIPYAHAGRWEEPRLARWKGVRDATFTGVSCMQCYPSKKATEDCLKLNVMTPSSAEGPEPLPVFVWFFGGGYLAGAASDVAFPGSEPVQHLISHGLVLVVPDFRVGIFGYLGSNRARNHSTGNWGTLDQVMSLKWVSTFIHKFGGDPTRVTVGGWSSGAASVSVILSMHTSTSLFHAAIMMSGGFTDWAAFTLASAEGTYEAFVEKAGCHSSLDCLSDGPPCDCLLSIPASRLVEIEGSFSWAPIVDGVVIQTQPYAALNEAKVPSMPILIGSALEDAFPVLPNDVTDADFKAWLEKNVPAKDVERAFDLYLGKKNRPTIDWIHAGISAAHWAAQRAKADRGQTCVARRVARHWPAGAWQYLWMTRFWGEDTSGFGPGISHSSDQHFLFQSTMPKHWEPVAKAYRQAVASFVLYGNPGKQWPEAGGEGSVFYSDGPIVQRIRPEHCDFWDAIDGA